MVMWPATVIMKERLIFRFFFRGSRERMIRTRIICCTLVQQTIVPDHSTADYPRLLLRIYILLQLACITWKSYSTTSPIKGNPFPRVLASPSETPVQSIIRPPSPPVRNPPLIYCFTAAHCTRQLTPSSAIPGDDCLETFSERRPLPSTTVRGPPSAVGVCRQWQ